MYERLKSYADHVFLMTGNNSKKEQRKILKLMHEVKNDESMILVATGSLVGEGFDFQDWIHFYGNTHIIPWGS